MNVNKHAVRIVLLLVGFALCTTVRPQILSAGAAQAREFYVSPQGQNAAAGTLAKPFRTIQKCAQIAKAGDSCILRAGVYRETVTPANSGTADASITFKPYQAETVTINGAERIANWSLYQGKIYRAKVDWDLGDGKNQLFVDGKMMNEARFPNTTLDISRPTLAKAQGGKVNGETASLRDARLTQPKDYWVGARIWIAPTPNWVAQTGTVLASEPGSLNFTFTTADGTFSVGANDPYYLTGTLKALDSPGEWYLDAATHSLYLWLPAGDTPAKHIVQLKKRDFGFDLSKRAYITLEGLNLFATTITSDDASHHLLLDRLNAQYVSHFSVIGTRIWNSPSRPSGIMLRGHDSVIQNSIIAYSAGNGVMVTGTHQTVYNNVIHDVDYAGSDAAAVTTDEGAAKSTGHEIAYNTLYNAARSMVVHRNLTAGKIHHNDIYNFGLQLSDLGGTYCWATDGQGTEIAYNWIHDSFAQSGFGGGGIYLDAGSSNFVIHHNIVWNVPMGLILNAPSRDNLVYNNTLSGTVNSINSGQVGDMKGTVIKNNLLMAPMDIKADAVVGSNLNPGRLVQAKDRTAEDFVLRAASGAIDAGTKLPPYTDGFLGKAPDIGAYESGAPQWRVGSTLAAPSSPEAAKSKPTPAPSK